MKFSSFLVFICSLIWFDSDLILFATEMISTNHFQSAAFCDGWTRWNNIKEIKRVCLNAILTKPFVLLTKKILRGEGGGRCCCAVVESLFISIHKVFLGLCDTHNREKKGDWMAAAAAEIRNQSVHLTDAAPPGELQSPMEYHPTTTTTKKNGPFDWTRMMQHKKKQ